MDLLSRIDNARSLLRESRLANEAAVSSGVVLSLLDALGWPVFDPSTVAPEYSVGGRRVDFALLHRGKPVVFVEVKQPGHGVGADRQLFEYAFHEGVPLAVLTDGSTWHFYVPAMQGSYDERRAYLLDLLERDPEESAERLTRYLERSAVTSGAALTRAQEDYERAKQRRESRAALPAAWAALVEAADARLLDLLMGEVESRSGFRPEPEDALGFLTGLKAPSETQPRRIPRATRARLPTPNVAELRIDTQPAAASGIGYYLEGEFVPARNGRDALVRAFQALSDRDPGFLDRFISRPKHGNTRRYLARRPEDLFPKDPGFASPSTTAEVKPGYWLMVHASHQMLENIAKLACEDAGIRYGRDLRLKMK
jgi:predicted type IV restriction endonuclease